MGRPESFTEVLLRGLCQYIEGDTKDGSAVYCSGHPARPSVYCPAHREICYQKKKPRPCVAPPE